MRAERQPVHDPRGGVAVWSGTYPCANACRTTEGTSSASVNTPSAADVTGSTSPSYSACRNREREAAGAGSAPSGGCYNGKNAQRF